MSEKRFVDMTDKEKKAYRVINQLKYNKTEKGMAASARRDAKFVKKLSPVQRQILKALKEGACLRMWHYYGYYSRWRCELRGRNNRLLRSGIQIHTVELLRSEKKQGMLLKMQSKREDEIIYVISKKGLLALDKKLKKDNS